MIQLSQALSELDWIPRPKLTALRRLGIETVEDLVTHFPRRHEDRREFAGFPREESDVPICLCGEVVKTQLRRFGGWKKIFEATLQESDANALVVTHLPNMAAAFPQWTSGLLDGETLVLGSDGKGGATLVARIKIEQWSTMK